MNNYYYYLNGEHRTMYFGNTKKSLPGKKLNNMNSYKVQACLHYICFFVFLGNSFLESDDTTLLSERQNLKNELECSSTKYVQY